MLREVSAPAPPILPRENRREDLVLLGSEQWPAGPGACSTAVELALSDTSINNELNECEPPSQSASTLVERLNDSVHA